MVKDHHRQQGTASQRRPHPPAQSCPPNRAMIVGMKGGAGPCAFAGGHEDGGRRNSVPRERSRQKIAGRGDAGAACGSNHLDEGLESACSRRSAPPPRNSRRDLVDEAPQQPDDSDRFTAVVREGSTGVVFRTGPRVRNIRKIGIATAMGGIIRGVRLGRSVKTAGSSFSGMGLAAERHGRQRAEEHPKEGHSGSR